jgi:hypothetical protein
VIRRRAPIQILRRGRRTRVRATPSTGLTAVPIKQRRSARADSRRRTAGQQAETAMRMAQALLTSARSASRESTATPQGSTSGDKP